MLRVVDRAEGIEFRAGCDYCGKIVENAGHGIFLWRAAGPGPKPAANAEVVILHKGLCDDAYELEQGIERAPWTELTRLPILLGRGMGLDF